MKRKVIAAILALVMAIGMAVPAMAANIPSEMKSPIWTVDEISNQTSGKGTMTISITPSSTGTVVQSTTSGTSGSIGIGSGSNTGSSSGMTTTLYTATAKFSNGSTVKKVNGGPAYYVTWAESHSSSGSSSGAGNTSSVVVVGDGFTLGGYYYSVEIETNIIGPAPSPLSISFPTNFSLNQSTGITIAEGYAASAGTTLGIAYRYNAYCKITKYPANRSVTFTDVPAKQWYYNPIKTAYQTKLIEGSHVDSKGKVTFLPNDNLTLAHSLTLVSRIHALRNNKTIRSTKSSEQWYDPYVEYAKNNSLFPNSLRSMAMNKYVTRGEFAAIAATVITSKDIQVNEHATYSIPDVTTNTAYYSAIQKLYKAGIAAGNDAKGTYKPSSKLTRAEAATILSRVMLYGERVDTSHLKK